MIVTLTQSWYNTDVMIIKIWIIKLKYESWTLPLMWATDHDSDTDTMCISETDS